MEKLLQTTAAALIWVIKEMIPTKQQSQVLTQLHAITKMFGLAKQRRKSEPSLAKASSMGLVGAESSSRTGADTKHNELSECTEQWLCRLCNGMPTGYYRSKANSNNMSQTMTTTLYASNQIKSKQDLYSTICSRGFRGAWRMDYVHTRNILETTNTYTWL